MVRLGLNATTKSNAGLSTKDKTVHEQLDDEKENNDSNDALHGWDGEHADVMQYADADYGHELDENDEKVLGVVSRMSSTYSHKMLTFTVNDPEVGNLTRTTAEQGTPFTVRRFVSC